MFKNNFNPGDESNQGGASGTSASDSNSMIINYGRTPLKDIFDAPLCNVQDLVHTNGVNFTSIYFLPMFIDGKTYLSTVLNSDNKRFAPVRKLPGGTSTKGETLRENIAREMAEETGFIPTQVTFVDHVVVPSKEDKEVGHSDHTHFKILVWVNTKKGSMLQKNMRDFENSEHSFISIEELMSAQNFNRGHRDFLKKWITFMVMGRMDKIFPDLYKYA